MNTSFVNRRDRIIVSAIEIISEAGLASLTTKTLAMKENMSESLLYRYFGGIDEVIIEVVNVFTQFDHGLFTTIDSKEISHFSKVLELLRTYGVYYNSYPEIASIILNYEELLHNVNTRVAISKCIGERTSFVKKQLRGAIQSGEIIDTFSEEELCNIFFGSMCRDLLNRRIQNNNQPHDEAVNGMLDKLADMLRVTKES